MRLSIKRILALVVTLGILTVILSLHRSPSGIGLIIPRAVAQQVFAFQCPGNTSTMASLSWGLYDQSLVNYGCIDLVTGNMILGKRVLVAPSANSSRDASVQINAAMALAIANNIGTIDATFFGQTSQVLSQQVNIGTSSSHITLHIDPATSFTVATSGGIDAITISDGSALDCSPMHGITAGGNFGSGGFYFAGNPGQTLSSIVAPAAKNGSQEMFALYGCTFYGAATGTISDSIVNVQGVFINSILRDVNIAAPYNTIGLHVQPGTGASGGLQIVSDVNIENVQVNGNHVTNARPCVFEATATGNTGRIQAFGGGCQHAGSGQYEVEINGNGSGSRITGLFFYGFGVETATGSKGWLIRDAKDVLISGASLSGGGASTSVFDIQESGASNTQNIQIRGAFSSTASTNWVSNTANGGRNLPFSNELGGYSFKSPYNESSFTATTFATLGTPSNGVMLYCSDCTIANPCAGAGTGAMAKRLNSVWVCN